MKILTPEMMDGSEREVKCPKGGFVSRRMLLESDGMGYTITHTTITPGMRQRWHYKNHLESCYCLKGSGILTEESTGNTHRILPGIMYVLDKNDAHWFIADVEVQLLCIFNPPLKGKEVHQEDGSYLTGVTNE